MTHRIKMTFLALFSLSSIALVAYAHADEEKIALDKVPKPVMKAFKAKFPKAEVKAAIKEEEDGKTTYEIESILDGLSVDAILKPDGEIVTIEQQIKVADLPSAVSAAVKDKFPKAKMMKAEAVTNKDKTSYEVTVEKADGKKAVLLIDKAGSSVEEEK